MSVIDNGIGMSPEDLAHVGERFWRFEDERVRVIKGMAGDADRQGLIG